MVIAIGAPEVAQFTGIELLSSPYPRDPDRGRGGSLEVGAQCIAYIAGITPGRRVVDLKGQRAASRTHRGRKRQSQRGSTLSSSTTADSARVCSCESNPTTFVKRRRSSCAPIVPGDCPAVKHSRPLA
jgi:hypothetical protein